MQNTQTIIDNINDSHAVVKDSFNGMVKGIQSGMYNLGKWMSDKAIYKHGYPSADVKFLNFQAVYKRWLASYYQAGNFAGAELLEHDLELFKRHWTRPRKIIPAKGIEILTRLRLEINSLEECLVI